MGKAFAFSVKISVEGTRVAELMPICDRTVGVRSGACYGEETPWSALLCHHFLKQKLCERVNERLRTVM